MDTHLRARRTAVTVVLFGVFSFGLTLFLLALVLRHADVASGSLLLIGSSAGGLRVLRPNTAPRMSSEPPWRAESRRRRGTLPWVRRRHTRRPPPGSPRRPIRVSIAATQTRTRSIPIVREVAALAAHLPDLQMQRIAGLLYDGRQHTVQWASSLPLTLAQRRQVAASLDMLQPRLRWRGAVVQVADLTMPASTSTTPCVPLLSVGRSIVWWPLAHGQHLLLAGDALPTVALQVAALYRLTPESPPLVVDPEQRLAALDGYHMPAMPQALEQMQVQSQQALWHAHTGTSETRPAQHRVVIAPDAATWRELLPLLRATVPTVQCIVVLGTTLPPVVRDLCHCLPVVWMGSAAGALLPEAFRPAQLRPPRPDHAVAWWQGRTLWSGRALRWDAATHQCVLGDGMRHTDVEKECSSESHG